MFQILSILFGLGGLVCAIIILIDAFQNAVWKGLVGLLCFLYLIYFAFVEFDHPKKWQVIGGWIGCGVLSTIFSIMGMAGRV